MFIHKINPVLFKIGYFEIRYYGIIFALGFVLGYFIINHLVSKKEINLTKEDVSDLLFYVIISAVIGARTLFVLYNIKYFIENPLEIIAVWHGGLIFLGGFIGAVTSGIIFCKKKKIAFYQIADIVVIPLALGLALGRIANFLNGEIVGRVSSVPWAVKFPGYEGFRHPSQLYESLKNFFIFGCLWFLKNKKLKDGILFWSFLVLYSFLRFFIAFFKEVDQYGTFLGLTPHQFIYGTIFIISTIFILKINKK
ncbi:MAG: prolipoprotein diacylglyceryl transferase [Nanoarchaeota archaeon]